MKTGTILMIIGGVVLLTGVGIYLYKKSDETTSGIDGDCGCGCGGTCGDKKEEKKANACGCGA